MWGKSLGYELLLGDNLCGGHREVAENPIKIGYFRILLVYKK